MTAPRRERSAWLLVLFRYRHKTNYADVLVMPMLVAGTAAGGGVGLGWGGAVERSLLDLQVGVEVGACRVGWLVAEPEGGRGGGDPCGEQPHRAGVAQDVRG